MRPSGGRDAVTLIALGGALALVPRFITSDYYLSIPIFIALYTLVAVGLVLVLGYAGQLSMAQATFYGLGAYVSAILTTSVGLSPWLALVIAAILNCLFAFLVGIPIFRLRGHFLAMATLGLTIIVQLVLIEQYDLTGGPSGITGIPQLAAAGFTFDRDAKFFYLAWAVALVGIWIALNVARSRIGRALLAINGAEVAAEAMGVDAATYKAQVFALSAVYASVAGSLYAHYLTVVNPGPFGFGFSIQVVVMVVVGMRLSVWGGLVGAAITTVLSELLRAVVPAVLGRDTGEYQFIAFGLILILVLLFMPEGVVGGLERAQRRLLRRSRARIGATDAA